MEHRQVTFGDESIGLIKDIPGQVEITLHGPVKVKRIEKITKERHSTLEDALSKGGKSGHNGDNGKSSATNV